MFDTRLTRRFGLATPIVNAGMAMVARSALAAAVSKAGGLGTIGCDISPPEALRAMVRDTQRRTARLFGVDLIGDFVTDDHIDVLIGERVALVIFFWSPPTATHVARLHAAGTDVWLQVGSVAEARDGAALGVDALIVQGAEAGGHTRSEASTMTRFPRVRALLPDLALLAAGGIADGRTMAAALVLGADAVWCGTRFLAAQEANAHRGYQQRVVDSDVGDTVVTRLYGPEWPDQPMRAIVNAGLRAALGREAEATAQAVGRTMGSVEIGGERMPLPPHSAILPMASFEGDLEQACLTAGQSAGNVSAVLPAATIVQRMTDDAMAALATAGLSGALATPANLRRTDRETPVVAVPLGD